MKIHLSIYIFLLVGFSSCIHIDNFSKRIETIQNCILDLDSQLDFEMVFENVLNISNFLLNDINSYLYGVNIKHSFDEYIFVKEKFKPNIQSFVNEINFLKFNCKSNDEENEILSKYITLDIMYIFLQEWNSTLEYFNNNFKTNKYPKNKKINVSTSVIHHHHIDSKPDFYIFKDCNESFCSEYSVIPRSTFFMGEIDSEIYNDLNEFEPVSKSWSRPYHKVEINKSFSMGVYEITKKQFRQFINETNHQIPNGCLELKNFDGKTKLFFNKLLNYENPGYDQSEDHPVVCVRKEDAMEFSKWLSLKTQRKYRLATESEWEYVARSNSGSFYYSWGNSTEDSCNYANIYNLVSINNFNFSINSFNCKDNISGMATKSVGSYVSNKFGLYDISGNVKEIVDDCWHNSYVDSPSNEIKWDIDNNGQCSLGIVRGSSWISSPSIDVSLKFPIFLQSKSNYIGFRLVREITLEHHQYNKYKPKYYNKNF